MKELGIIQSALNVPKGQFNEFGKYKYRSCEDILAALKPLLKQNDCTLTISDDIMQVGNRFYIKATASLTNSNGEQVTVTAFAREEDSKKGMDASQVTGAASSYARKYALNGLFAIDDTKDADALNMNPQYTQPVQTPFPPPQNAQQASQQLSTTELFQAYAKPAIEQARTKEELVRIFNDYQVLHGMKEFMSAMTDRKKKLGIGKK
jgi:hypothetical protein|nr:MAG TPA: ERF superfamily protein [Caudoviricetes sp.]